MPTLTLAGSLDLEVQSNNARSPARVRVGGTVRAFDGTLRSTVRSYKRVWGPWQTKPLTESEYTALVSAVSLGVIAVSGDFTGTVNAADVEITGEEYIWDLREDTGRLIVCTLEIREV